MKLLEQVYITHRYLLEKYNVQLIWTENSNPTDNCATLTSTFKSGANEYVDRLAKCCDLLREWPVANAGHDTMWASPNRKRWFKNHSSWLHEQCDSEARRILELISKPNVDH